jgi:hypothetical protein
MTRSPSFRYHGATTSLQAHVRSEAAQLRRRCSSVHFTVLCFILITLLKGSRNPIQGPLRGFVSCQLLIVKGRTLHMAGHMPQDALAPPGAADHLQVRYLPTEDTTLPACACIRTGTHKGTVKVDATAQRCCNTWSVNSRQCSGAFVDAARPAAVPCLRLLTAVLCCHVKAATVCFTAKHTCLLCPAYLQQHTHAHAPSWLQLCTTHSATLQFKVSVRLGQPSVKMHLWYGCAVLTS